MPRKSRTKFKSPSNNSQFPSSSSRSSKTDGVIIRNPFTNENADIRVMLKCLNEMFDGKVDSEVIFTVFSACDFNVNETIEALISVSTDGSSSSSLSHKKLEEPSFSLTDRACSTSCKDTSFDSSGQFKYTELTGEEGNCDTNLEIGRRLCSLSLQDRFGSENPSVPSKSNKTENHIKVSYTTSNNVINEKSYLSESHVSGSEENTAADSVCQIFDSSVYQPFPSKYSVPSFGSVETVSVSSFVENGSKIYLPHPTQQFEPLHQNNIPFYCNQSSSFGGTASPPKFITPLFLSYRPKGQSKVSNYQSFKNQGLETSVPWKKDSGPSSYRQPDLYNKTMIKEVIDKIIINCKVLIILRGLPGSGKSTLASRLKYSGVVFSTDDYFYKRGKYCFRWEKLSEAHEWNRSRTARALGKGITPVIIDNTNIERWEMKPYIVLGLQFNYDIYILEPDNPWKFKPGELAKRNRHKVSKEKIERMLERYEHNVTVESIVEPHQNTDLGDTSGLEEISVFDTVQNENSSQGSEIDLTSGVQGEQQFNSIRNAHNAGNLSEEELVICRKHCERMSSLDGENSNFLLLEADVHREDETTSSQSLSNEPIEHSNSSGDISVNESCSNNSVSSEIAGTSGEIEACENGPNGSTEGLDELQNFMCLKDLVVLTEQSSEECQTSSNQVSPSCSSHDSSNWEVITNQEDGFLWASNPQLAFQKVEEPDITYSEQSNVNNGESLFIKEEQAEELLVSEKKSDDEIGEKVCSLLISSAPCGNIIAQNKKGIKTGSVKVNDCLDWGVTESPVQPKPQREVANISHRRTGLSTYPNSSNYSPIRKNRVLTEWGSIAEEEESSSDWNDDSGFTESKLEKSSDMVLPKPQRNFGSNNGISTDVSFHKIVKRGESPQGTLLATVPESEELLEERKLPVADARVSLPNTGKKRKHDNLLGSLSSGCFSGLDWKFPDFVSESPGLPAVKIPPKPFTTCSETQTELQDFIFLYQSLQEDVQNENYKVLTLHEPSEKSDEHLKQAAKECSDILVPSICRFDKSTTTHDIAESVEDREKLQILQDCFPDISFEELKHHYQAFQGDTDWLINTLLDWGYKYCVDSICSAPVSDQIKLEEGCVPVNNCEEVTQYKGAMANGKFSAVTEVINNTISTSELLFPSVNIYDSFKADTFSGGCFAMPTFVDNSVSEKADVGNEVVNMSSHNVSSAIFTEDSQDLQNFRSPSDLQVLQLRLDPAFVLQLEERFGPVQQGTSSFTYSGQDCVIDVDMDLAREIHKRWCRVVQRIVTDIKDVADIKEAVDFQEQESEISNSLEGACGNFQPGAPECELKSGEMSFAEIMDHEYALHILEKERTKSQRRKNSVAARLKREKLYRKFPGVDKRALDEILEANKFSLKNAIIALEADIGRSSPLSEQSVEMDHESFDERNFEDSNQVLDSNCVLQDFASENWTDWIEQGPRESMGELRSSGSIGLDNFCTDASTLREDANYHHTLHRQYMERAQHAYQNGKKEAVCYYQQKSHYHLDKFKEINKEAVEIILEENRLKNSNPLVLDLHGLYVPEAVQALEKFMKLKRIEYFNSSDTDPLIISVITGHGARSVNGPKLRSSVIEFLKSKGYWFEQVNNGMFNVTVAQKQ